MAFLYDMLGASRSKRATEEVRAGDIDEVILGHTNEPGYKRFRTRVLEAIRDRT